MPRGTPVQATNTPPQTGTITLADLEAMANSGDSAELGQSQQMVENYNAQMQQTPQTVQAPVQTTPAQNTQPNSPNYIPPQYVPQPTLYAKPEAQLQQPVTTQTEEVDDMDDEDDTVEVVQDTAKNDAEAFSLAEAKKLRRENAKYRVELKAIRDQLSSMDAVKAKLQELEDASLSDRERERVQLERTRQELAAERARAAELQARNSEQSLYNKVLGVSQKLRIHDPDAAYRLLDRSEVEVIDGNEVDSESVEKALKKLIREKGYLVQRVETQQVATGNPQRTNNTPEDQRPRQKMTYAEHHARIHGNASSFWEDPRAQGGGVKWNARGE